MAGQELEAVAVRRNCDFPAGPVTSAVPPLLTRGNPRVVAIVHGTLTPELDAALEIPRLDRQFLHEGQGGEGFTGEGVDLEHSDRFLDRVLPIRETQEGSDARAPRLDLEPPIREIQRQSRES